MCLLFVVINMQMDAKFEKEQIGTLIVWIGPPGGGLGGGWSLRGVRPNFVHSFKKKVLPSCMSSC